MDRKTEGLTEEEIKIRDDYYGQFPFCAYCGGKIKRFVLKVKGGTEWEERCGNPSCEREPFVNKKFIDWNYISVKMAIFLFVIILAICYLIGTYNDVSR